MVEYAAQQVIGATQPRAYEVKRTLSGHTDAGRGRWRADADSSGGEGLHSSITPRLYFSSNLE